MTRNHYIPFFVLFLICGSFAAGCVQPASKVKANENLSAFRLIITTYNHAERINDGTSIYIVTDSSITVKKRYMLSEKDTTLFSKKITADYILPIKKINLNTLKGSYFNNCIMITSGTEYDVSTTRGHITKDIHLHCYYLWQIDEIIKDINKMVPAEYQINYVAVDNKQDCEL